MSKLLKCTIPRLREYPGCFEDCDYGDTDTCPNHKHPEPQPDGSKSLTTGSRLLTDEEIKVETERKSPQIIGYFLTNKIQYDRIILNTLLKAQDAKTHSLDQSHYQEKLRKVKEGIEKHSHINSMDFRCMLESWWQSFWKEVLGL